MKTPKTVRIGKLRYKVHTVKALHRTHGAGSGRIDFAAKTIHVATHSKNGVVKYTKKQLDIAMWHEIVHGILFSMRQHKLNDDEKFVEEFAQHVSDIIEHFEKAGHFAELCDIESWRRRQARLHLATLDRLGARL